MELILPTAIKKLDLVYDIDAQVPRWVSADYARIRQVLMNLIGNSVKVRGHNTYPAELFFLTILLVYPKRRG